MEHEFEQRAKGFSTLIYFRYCDLSQQQQQQQKDLINICEDVVFQTT